MSIHAILAKGAISPPRGLREVEAGAGAHVLVVDDDAAIRDTLRLALEDAGYQVEGVADGVTALNRLRTASERYIVLLDLIMPGMGGQAVLADIANDNQIATRHAYILVTAAQERLTTAGIESTLARLSAPILHKPFDLDVLLTMVSEAQQRLG